MAGKSVYPKRGDFRLNERQNVMDKLRHYVGAVCVYPLAGDLFFDICYKADVASSVMHI